MTWLKAVFLGFIFYWQVQLLASFFFLQLGLGYSSPDIFNLTAKILSFPAAPGEKYTLVLSTTFWTMIISIFIKTSMLVGKSLLERKQLGVDIIEDTLSTPPSRFKIFCKAAIVMPALLALIFFSVLAINKFVQPQPGNAHGWAMTASSMLSERNNMRYDLLAGFLPTHEVITKWKQMLKDWWDVGNREELLETLKWIEEEGHRKEFDYACVTLRKLQHEDILKLLNSVKYDEEINNRISFVLANSAKLENKSLIGWDFIRYINLCRWGYLTGYLTEKEAWSRIMPASRLLQKTFNSWQDLGDNYLLGREFWSYEQTKESGDVFKKVYQALLTKPSSPWNTVPWQMDLNRQ